MLNQQLDAKDNEEPTQDDSEPIEVNFSPNKGGAAEAEEEIAEVPFDYQNDPFLQSAIEFMYSEDSEDDFTTMDRQKQEALLKKTWMERERQFYGEEVDEDIIEEQDEEQDASSEEEEDELDRDDTIKAVQGILEQHDKLERSDKPIASHFQVMRAKQMQMQDLHVQLKHKQKHVNELQFKLE